MELNSDRLRSLSTFKASFSNRTATYSTDYSTTPEPAAEANYDFLTLLTCVTDLYSQDGVFEMQKIQGELQTSSTLASGATATVSKIKASLTQPSASAAYQVLTQEQSVVLKKYPCGLYKANGQPRDLQRAHSLITELRILSHRDIRSTAEIVTLLGLHWDTSNFEAPEPVMVLEYAPWDLSQFLESFPSLPFATKLDLSLNIAMGLQKLHAFGITHGDVKPQNVLIFDNPFRAKIADFGHSLFDTGVITTLPGGTSAYAAPELDAQPASKLKLTDVFSYGLVFASIMCGFEVTRKICDDQNSTSLEQLKRNDGLAAHISGLLHSVDDPSIDDHRLATDILIVTVRTDPGQRCLQRAIDELSLRRSLIQAELPMQNFKPVYSRLNDLVLAIPYQALESIKTPVTDQAVRALEYIATCSQDPRSIAACWELCVCYCSDFGLPRRDIHDDERFSRRALQFLVQAAEGGDDLARLAIYPLFSSVGMEVPNQKLHLQWLGELASSGSVTAMSQIVQLYPARASAVRDAYWLNHYNSQVQILSGSSTDLDALVAMETILNSRGDTAIHLAASVGNITLLEQIFSMRSSTLNVNSQNISGDTPLLQAARAGHKAVVNLLVQNNADGSILNHVKESVLHFLVEFSHLDLEQVTKALVKAGAWKNLQTISLDTTYNKLHRMHPNANGTPAYRAVVSGNLEALNLLFDVEATVEDPSLKTSFATLRLMLAHAVKLRHVDVVELLIKKIREYPSSQEAPPIMIWDNGRLRTIGELFILGSVSTNETSGFNWPESFSRMICFGSSYREVIQLLFHLLEEHRYLSQDISEYMDMAIRFSRRDAALVLASSLVDHPYQLCKMRVHRVPKKSEDHQVLNPWRDNYARIYRGSSQIICGPDFDDTALPWLASDRLPWQIRYGSDFTLAGQAMISTFSTSSHSVLQSTSSPLKDHQRAWALVEWVEYAILNAEHAIFQDLLNFEQGLALKPGTKSHLLVIPRSEYDATDNTGNINHLYPPPSAACIVKAVENNNHTTSSRNAHLLYDGTLNYALKYMNTISQQNQNDIYFAQILLSTIAQLFSVTDVLWTSSHWFEELCLGSSTYFEAGIVSPLFHAIIRQWDDLIVLLLNAGASVQDRLVITSESVLDAVLKASYDPCPRLTKIIQKSTDVGLNVDRIVNLGNLESILLHTHNVVLPASKVKRPFIPGLLELPELQELLRSSYYTITIGWILEDGRPKLKWTKPHDVREKEKQLWTAIAESGINQSPLRPRHHRRSFCINLAVMQQNVYALRCLLGIGLEPILPAAPVPTIPIEPIHYTRWTASIADSQCCTSGLELKQVFKEMTQLLEFHSVSTPRVISPQRLVIYDWVMSAFCPLLSLMLVVPMLIGYTHIIRFLWATDFRIHGSAEMIIDFEELNPNETIATRVVEKSIICGALLLIFLIGAILSVAMWFLLYSACVLAATIAVPSWNLHHITSEYCARFGYANAVADFLANVVCGESDTAVFTAIATTQTRLDNLIVKRSLRMTEGDRKSALSAVSRSKPSPLEDISMTIEFLVEQASTAQRISPTVGLLLRCRHWLLERAPEHSAGWDRMEETEREQSVMVTDEEASVQRLTITSTTHNGQRGASAPETTQVHNEHSRVVQAFALRIIDRIVSMIMWSIAAAVKLADRVSYQERRRIARQNARVTYQDDIML